MHLLLGAEAGIQNTISWLRSWPDEAACVLASLTSFLIGFFWLRESVADRTGAHAVFGSKVSLLAVTTIGAGFLSKWNVAHPEAFHGLFWVLGTVAGVFISRAKLVREYAAHGNHLPPDQRSKVENFVRRTLFQCGHAQTEIQLGKMIEKFDAKRHKMLSTAVEELHKFIHIARDDAIQFMAEFERAFDEAFAVRGGDIDWFLHKMQDEFKRYIANIAHKIVPVFDALVGRPRGTWVAIRLIEQSEQRRAYKTIARAGNVNPGRENSTCPIPEDAGLPRLLRQKYDTGKGIVRIGDRTATNWYATSNDDRHEDRSVLAGPIMVKARDPDGNQKRSEMFMILYVNSPRENEFQEIDEEFVRCCTDTLSLFFSMAWKMLPDIQVNRENAIPE